jgi:hypothetical protein
MPFRRYAELEKYGQKGWDIPGPFTCGFVFNGKLRDEFLNREIFYTLKEAQVLIEGWRREYNTIRPHSSLGYRPPAPEVIQPRSHTPFILPLSSTPLKGEYTRPLT